MLGAFRLMHSINMNNQTIFKSAKVIFPQIPLDFVTRILCKGLCLSRCSCMLKRYFSNKEIVFSVELYPICSMWITFIWDNKKITKRLPFVLSALILMPINMLADTYFIVNIIFRKILLGWGREWSRGLGLAYAHWGVWNDWPTGTWCIAQWILPNILW